jgi:hypothetical protein
VIGVVACDNFFAHRHLSLNLVPFVSEFPILDFQHRYLTADVAMPDKERNGPDLDTIEPSRAEDQSRPSVPTAMIR